MVMLAVSQNGHAFQYAGEDLRCDYKFILQLLSSLNEKYNHLRRGGRKNSNSNKYNNNSWMDFLRYVDENAILNSQKFWYDACFIQPRSLYYASEDHVKSDPCFFIHLIHSFLQKYHTATNNNNNTNQNKNKPIIANGNLVRSFFSCIRYADQSLRSDRGFFLSLLSLVNVIEQEQREKRSYCEKIFSSSSSNVHQYHIDKVLNYTSESLKKDECFFLASIYLLLEPTISRRTKNKEEINLNHMRIYVDQILQHYAHPKVKHGSKLIIDLLRGFDEKMQQQQKGNNTKNKHYRNNNNNNNRLGRLLRKFSRKEGCGDCEEGEDEEEEEEEEEETFYYQNEAKNYTLKFLKEFFHPIMFNNGMMIRYTHQMVRKDKEVVFDAVSEDGNALQYADSCLKKDLEIILAAIFKKPSSIVFADQKFLREDKKAALAVLGGNVDVLPYLPRDLQGHEQIIQASVQEYSKRIEHFEKQRQRQQQQGIHIKKSEEKEEEEEGEEGEEEQQPQEERVFGRRMRDYRNNVPLLSIYLFKRGMANKRLKRHKLAMYDFINSYFIFPNPKARFQIVNHSSILMRCLIDESWIEQQCSSFFNVPRYDSDVSLHFKKKVIFNFFNEHLLLLSEENISDNSTNNPDKKKTRNPLLCCSGSSSKQQKDEFFSILHRFFYEGCHSSLFLFTSKSKMKFHRLHQNNNSDDNNNNNNSDEKKNVVSTSSNPVLNMDEKRNEFDAVLMIRLSGEICVANEFIVTKKFLHRTTYHRVFFGRYSIFGYEGVKEGMGKEYEIISNNNNSNNSNEQSTHLYHLNNNINNNNVIFKGNYRNGMREGKGIELNGELVVDYEGLYRKGLRHGIGEMYDQKKHIYIRGVWKKGKLVETKTSYQCPVIDFSQIQHQLNHSCLIGAGGYGMVYKVKASEIPVQIFNPKKNKKKKHKMFDDDDDEEEEEDSDCTDTDTDEDDEYVAVKIFFTKSPMNRDFMFRQVKQAIELCGSVEDKRNILVIRGIIRGQQIGYIMELCSYSVDEIISINREDYSTIEEKFRILRETASGMLQLHKKYIMHRDLKWANVLLNRKGQVKITDFDTAKEDNKHWKWNIQHTMFCDGMPGSGGSGGKKSSSSTNTTSTTTNKKKKKRGSGKVFGTAEYIAPELLIGGGGKYGVEVDVYSFSIMMYSLIFSVNNPYQFQEKCPGCGTLLSKISRLSLLQHVSKHNLRPKILPHSGGKNNSVKFLKKYNFLIELMKMCWDANPKNRPNFQEISRIFDLEMSKRKCYAIIKVIILEEHHVRQQQQQQEKEKEGNNNNDDDEYNKLLEKHHRKNDVSDGDEEEKNKQQIEQRQKQKRVEDENGNGYYKGKMLRILLMKPCLSELKKLIREQSKRIMSNNNRMKIKSITYINENFKLVSDDDVFRMIKFEDHPTIVVELSYKENNDDYDSLTSCSSSSSEEEEEENNKRNKKIIMVKKMKKKIKKLEKKNKKLVRYQNATCEKNKLLQVEISKLKRGNEKLLKKIKHFEKNNL